MRQRQWSWKVLLPDIMLQSVPWRRASVALRPCCSPLGAEEPTGAARCRQGKKAHRWKGRRKEITGMRE